MGDAAVLSASLPFPTDDNNRTHASFSFDDDGSVCATLVVTGLRLGHSTVKATYGNITATLTIAVYEPLSILPFYTSGGAAAAAAAAAAAGVKEEGSNHTGGNNVGPVLVTLGASAQLVVSGGPSTMLFRELHCEGGNGDIGTGSSAVGGAKGGSAGAPAATNSAQEMMVYAAKAEHPGDVDIAVAAVSDRSPRVCACGVCRQAYRLRCLRHGEQRIDVTIHTRARFLGQLNPAMASPGPVSASSTVSVRFVCKVPTGVIISVPGGLPVSAMRQEADEGGHGASVSEGSPVVIHTRREVTVDVALVDFEGGAPPRASPRIFHNASSVSVSVISTDPSKATIKLEGTDAATGGIRLGLLTAGKSTGRLWLRAVAAAFVPHFVVGLIETPTKTGDEGGDEGGSDSSDPSDSSVRALHLALPRVLKDRVQVELVDQVALEPRRVTIFNHPDNLVRVDCKGGTGNHDFAINDTSAAKMVIDGARRFVTLRPLPVKNGGFTGMSAASSLAGRAVELGVEDDALDGKDVATAEVFISNAARIDVLVDTKVALGSAAVMRVVVSDALGRPFPLSQYPYMNLTVSGLGAIVALQPRSRKQESGGHSQGMEAAPRGLNGTVFHLHARSVGTARLLVSVLNSDESQGPGSRRFYSAAVDVEVFAALRAVPRWLTLFPGSSFTLRATGGPPTGAHLRFSSSNQSVVTVDGLEGGGGAGWSGSDGGSTEGGSGVDERGAGMLLAGALGTSLVRVQAVADSHDGSGNLLVYAEDTVAVRVAPLLDGVVVVAPSKRLLVGREVKLHLRGSNGESPFMFGQAKGVQFKWEVANDELCILWATRETTVQGERAPIGQWSDVFSVWLRGSSAGRCTVRVWVRVEVPAGAFGEGSLVVVKELTDSVTINVIEPLRFVSEAVHDGHMSSGGGHHGGVAHGGHGGKGNNGQVAGSPRLLLYPGSGATVRTNRDGKDHLVFRLLHLGTPGNATGETGGGVACGGDGAGGVATVDQHGWVQAGDLTGRALLTVVDTIGEQALSVMIVVRPIAQVLLVPVAPHFASIPVGGRAELAVVMVDDQGNPFGVLGGVHPAMPGHGRDITCQTRSSAEGSAGGSAGGSSSCDEGRDTVGLVLDGFAPPPLEYMMNQPDMAQVEPLSDHRGFGVHALGQGELIIKVWVRPGGGAGGLGRGGVANGAPVRKTSALEAAGGRGGDGNTWPSWLTEARGRPTADFAEANVHLAEWLRLSLVNMILPASPVRLCVGGSVRFTLNDTQLHAGQTMEGIYTAANPEVLKINGYKEKNGFQLLAVASKVGKTSVFFDGVAADGRGRASMGGGNDGTSAGGRASHALRTVTRVVVTSVATILMETNTFDYVTNVPTAAGGMAVYRFPVTFYDETGLRLVTSPNTKVRADGTLFPMLGGVNQNIVLSCELEPRTLGRWAKVTAEFDPASGDHYCVVTPQSPQNEEEAPDMLGIRLYAHDKHTATVKATAQNADSTALGYVKFVSAFDLRPPPNTVLNKLGCLDLSVHRRHGEVHVLRAGGTGDSKVRGSSLDAASMEVSLRTNAAVPTGAGAAERVVWEVHVPQRSGPFEKTWLRFVHAETGQTKEFCVSYELSTIEQGYKWYCAWQRRESGGGEGASGAGDQGGEGAEGREDDDVMLLARQCDEECPALIAHREEGRGADGAEGGGGGDGGDGSGRRRHNGTRVGGDGSEEELGKWKRVVQCCSPQAGAACDISERADYSYCNHLPTPPTACEQSPTSSLHTQDAQVSLFVMCALAVAVIAGVAYVATRRGGSKRARPGGAPAQMTAMVPTGRRLNYLRTFSVLV